MPHAVDANAILDRLAAARGGVRNSFDQIDPARTAHLIVDMQNGFVEEGAPVEVPEARTVVDNINRISAAVREAGGLNLFIQFTTPADADQSWSVMYQRLGAMSGPHKGAFQPGSHYWELWPGLDVDPRDRTVAKGRFSAFTPGTSDTNAILREAGIETVIVTGTLTNVCCESTARDAMQHNYQVIMVPDANAALNNATHAATLESLAFVFADLRSTEEVESLLAGVDP